LVPKDHHQDMASCDCRLTSVSTARQAVRSLSEDGSKTLVQSFVSCYLGYCNSLFFGMRRSRQFSHCRHSVSISRYSSSGNLIPMSF